MIEIMSGPMFDRLRPLASRRRRVPQGAALFSRGDSVRALYLVERGMVELVRYQENGGRIVLQRGMPGTILAEASIYAGAYHCDGVAADPTEVSQIRLADFLTAIRQDGELAQDWAAYLAREIQSARLRVEILTRKTVAERLDGWLAWNSNLLPPKGAWKAIADEIGVTPEALYRELAKRRK